MMDWYLAYCRPREEHRASLHLRNQGVESYYPQVEVTKLHRGHRIARLEPMFPSYLFVRVDLDLFPPYRLNATRGLRHMVRYGKQWTKIPCELVYDLMCREDSDASRAILNQLPRCGDKVQIQQGNFAGLEALYQEPDGEQRSFLLLEMLHQRVRYSVDNREFALVSAGH